MKSKTITTPYVYGLKAGDFIVYRRKWWRRMLDFIFTRHKGKWTVTSVDKTSFTLTLGRGK
jgi:hypothetical protein